MPSKSPAQHRLMAAVAHNPDFAKKVGIPTSVGKDFAAADKKMNDGGVTKSLKKQGFYDEGKSKSERLKIINKETTKPERMEMVDKLFLEKKMKEGGSSVNEAGNYTKPDMRKRLFNSIKGSAVQGTGAGEWSARKAQLLAKRYKENGGGYRD
jgi:hypothetical protein